MAGEPPKAKDPTVALVLTILMIVVFLALLILKGNNIIPLGWDLGG